MPGLILGRGVCKAMPNLPQGYAQPTSNHESGPWEPKTIPVRKHANRGGTSRSALRCGDEGAT